MPSLWLSAREGEFAHAANLLPLSGGRMKTRPSAYQEYAPLVRECFAWGPSRWLVESENHWRVVHAQLGELADLGASTPLLAATAYQALTGGGVRTDRVYFGCEDGVLRYVEDTGSGYTLNTVTNTVLDGGGSPYSINDVLGIATWQERLFTLELTNRISHSLNNEPHAWDPLHTLEFQTGRKDYVRALQPTRDLLCVGCLDSIWAVTGTSPYNFSRQRLVDGRGAVGRLAMTSDGQRVWHVDEKGVFQLGVDEVLSAPLDELFDTPDYDAQLRLEPAGEYLYLLLHGRVFAMLLSERSWGEVVFPGTALGFWSTSDEMGVYGTTGIWRLSSDYTEHDVYKDLSEASIAASLETWDQVPAGADRQLLSRVQIKVRGGEGSTATYQAIFDGVSAYSEAFSLSDGTTPPYTGVGFWQDLSVAVPAFRELTPLVAGGALRHRIESELPFELVSFDAVIQSESLRERMA